VASASEEERRQLFAQRADPANRSRFFDRVADDVHWTVMGTHPRAGTYTSKQNFLRRTFERLDPLMRDQVRLEVAHLYLANDVAIAELRASSRAIDGEAFDNTYCWVCHFDGEQIVEVRAYLDSALVADLIVRAERESTSSSIT
jgi:ketosteroid isomerase-like protein